MKIRLLVMGMLVAAIVAANVGHVRAASAPKPPSAKKFDDLAKSALDAMKKRAAELNVTGVAVVSYAQGDTIQGWTSRMAVVGRMKDDPTATSKGNNLLGVAYAKSAEMARTLVNSGTSTGTIMTGEFGWQGGVVEHVKGGYLIVSFSGGKSEDDVQVSKAGLAVMKNGL